ncbi:MAG TPA: hypothetical protein VFM48_08805, partial [Aquabacterium sp.]|nr:hypothetical protein [Aquabacterium sp.]
MFQQIVSYLAVALMTLLLPSFACHAEPLRMGYFELPPHTTPQGKTGVRPALAYFSQIADQMGVTVQFKAYPLPRLIDLVTHNKLDGALMLARSDERAALLDYPESPFLITHPILLVRTDHPAKQARDVLNQTAAKVGGFKGGYRAISLPDTQCQWIWLSGEDILGRGMTMVHMKRLDGFFSPD